VIDDLTRLVNPTGRLGIAGVFTATDAAPAPQGGYADGSLQVPWATLFNKGVTVGFGRTHDRRYTTHLRDLIISGRARPSQIITHHQSLENGPSIYDRFDRRVDGIVKAVFNPHDGGTTPSMGTSAGRPHRRIKPKNCAVRRLGVRSAWSATARRVT
jgi:glutathione-independent formaldehyde dehydrogenase